MTKLHGNPPVDAGNNPPNAPSDKAVDVVPVTSEILDVPADATQLAAMKTLRAALLAQHKVLIDNDRQQYEGVFGPVPTGRFVQLITEDPWFRWLDPLSRLIVAIDEWEEQDPPQAGAGRDLAATAATLFGHKDETFGERYRQALQQAPEAVMGQGRVTAALRATPGGVAPAEGT